MNLQQEMSRTNLNQNEKFSILTKFICLQAYCVLSINIV
jgi:hypothetical protein